MCVQVTSKFRRLLYAIKAKLTSRERNSYEGSDICLGLLSRQKLKAVKSLIRASLPTSIVRNIEADNYMCEYDSPAWK